MFCLWSVGCGPLCGWATDSVYSAGGGRSSVESWCTTAVDLEEALSGVVEGDLSIFLLLMLLSRLTPLNVVFLTGF